MFFQECRNRPATRKCRIPEHRLYIQIYFSLVATIVIVSVMAPLTWHLFGQDHIESRIANGMTTVVNKVFSEESSVEEIERTINQLAESFGANLTLYGPDNTVIASTLAILPPVESPGFYRWSGVGESGPGIAFALAGGRSLVAGHAKHPGGTRLFVGILCLLTVAGILALAAYPIARRLTRRLERLQSGVEELGGGNLATRVPVEGSDEIAELARSFNESVERIEKLMMAQKNVLTTTSHEFRTPLTRMRVALELYSENPRQELKDELLQDIEELDNMVEEILTASRLDATTTIVNSEEVDLLALIAEEGSRCGAEITGESVVINGDQSLLRRLVRNLLENANRYGGGEIKASTVIDNGNALIRICDKGIGVSEEDRERIFEPFYRPAGHTEGAKGGVGFGLALVKRIAELHDGSVRCVPGVGGGACFEVRLAMNLSG